MKLFIKEEREKAGLSITELAIKAKVSKSYLSEIESCKKQNVSIVTICKIAHALGVPATSLFRCEK